MEREEINFDEGDKFLLKEEDACFQIEKIFVEASETQVRVVEYEYAGRMHEVPPVSTDTVTKEDVVSRIENSKEVEKLNH